MLIILNFPRGTREPVQEGRVYGALFENLGIMLNGNITSLSALNYVNKQLKWRQYITEGLLQHN